jgi:phosphate transport system permease protein
VTPDGTPTGLAPAGVPAPIPVVPGQAVRGPSAFQMVSDFFRAREEGLWRGAAQIAAILPFAALIGAVIVLGFKAWPAVQVNGWGFLTKSTWAPGSTYGSTVVTHGVSHPLGSSYGAWPLILGTIQTSIIAVLIALPVSVGAAFAITERLPAPIARVLGFAVELLAGVPSVVFGLWGVLTLGPFLAHHVFPHIANVMPNVPVFNYFSAPTGHGQGLLTGGIVLAIMIVPIITATTRDLLRQVPSLPKEGAHSLGMTEWEVARRVTLPWVRSGIIGATVLGLGRAIGETIAIAMVTGSIIQVAHNVYSPMTTIAATIVSNLDSAETDATGFAVSTLAEAALILAVISVAVNIVARMVINRTGRLGAPLGSGS